MKFYGRKRELEVLLLNQRQSEKTACFTVMIGRRCIGKTSLLLESVKEQKYVYLFVSRKIFKYAVELKGLSMNDM